MTKEFIIDEMLVKKLLQTVDKGLVKGIGLPIPGSMCVEAAVCYAMGLPHSDKPACVSNAVRSLKITLNDFYWSSNYARAIGMRRLAVAQLGTKYNFDDEEFAKRVAKFTIQIIVPIALRAAAVLNPKHSAKLESAAQICELDGNRAAADAAAYVVYDAAYAADVADVAAAAAYVAYDAAKAAAYAAVAYDAAVAAVYVAYAAKAAAYAADVAKAAKDKIYSIFAEGAVQILIDMKSEGSNFLYMTE